MSIYSFIYYFKVVTQFISFYSGWLLSWNFGIFEIQTEIRETYGGKSANVHNITSLTYTLISVT